MFNWFNPVPKSLEELKKQYKKLAIQHHPDLGGSNEEMQAINNEYDTLFNHLKNVHINSEGEVYTSTQDSAETPEEFREIINRIISINGITIELIGNWIWITGDTFNCKDVLKSLRFRWSRNKKAWYYHNDNYVKVSKKSFNLNDIRNMYGSTTIEKNDNVKVFAYA